MVHIAISVLLGKYFYLSQMKHDRYTTSKQCPNIERGERDISPKTLHQAGSHGNWKTSKTLVVTFCSALVIIRPNCDCSFAMSLRRRCKLFGHY